LPGVRDWGLLESAIGRPYTGYYRRIHKKAAALVESLTATTVSPTETSARRF